MENQYAVASKEDIWRLQSDMKSVYAVQAEHADRLLRLERRFDDDGRSKSVWGNTPSFTGIRGGTPQQDTHYNPAAEAFKNFSQDNSTSLLGSLHLDAEEEPRRGASRANSVRFDETALGQLTHTSRSSSEFFPLRTPSAFGSHPLTERSSSHKSEGRQSSTGLSTHSTGLNGLAFEQQGRNTLHDLQPQPAPGLLLLGPHPSIIRCWLGKSFSNETLRYVALNTGASRSAIARSWVRELGLLDQMYRDGEALKVKLQIVLPEATVHQPSAGSASPTAKVPSIDATVVVFDGSSEAETIQCFLGSDVLRSRNADILFSQDRVTLYDDEHNKLNVPLVRPERAATYEKLRTTNTSAPSPVSAPVPVSVPAPGDWRGQSTNQQSEPRPSTDAADVSSSASLASRSKAAFSRLDWSRVRQAKGGSPVGSGQPSPPMRDSDRDSSSAARTEQTHSQAPSVKATEPDIAITSPHPDASHSAEPNESWTSCRKSSTEHDQRKEPTFSSIASNSGQRNAGQGKGMKILKTRRMSSNRSLSTAADASRPEPSPSIWSAVSASEGGEHPDAAVAQPSPQVPDSQRRSYSTDLKSGLTSSSTSNGTRSSNPIGGASAFGWLNPSQAR